MPIPLVDQTIILSVHGLRPFIGNRAAGKRGFIDRNSQVFYTERYSTANSRITRAGTEKIVL